MGGETPNHHDARCHKLRQQIGRAPLIVKKIHEDRREAEADARNNGEAPARFLMRPAGLERVMTIQKIRHDAASRITNERRWQDRFMHDLDEQNEQTVMHASRDDADPEKRRKLTKNLSHKELPCLNFAIPPLLPWSGHISFA